MKFLAFERLGIILGIVLLSVFGFFMFQVYGGTTVGLSLKTNTDLENGLIGHWTFDGKNMKDNVADSSGSGNNGSLLGQTATTTLLGKIGQGLFLDGVDDYIDTPSNSAIGTKVTVSAWVYDYDVTSSYESIFRQCWVCATGAWILSHRSTTGQYMFGVADDSPSCQDEVYSDVLNANQWYHLVGIYDGLNIFFYQDGKLKHTIAVSANCQNMDLQDPDWIANGGGLNAILDDVRLYDRVLSAEEVQKLYELGG